MNKLKFLLLSIFVPFIIKPFASFDLFKKGEELILVFGDRHDQIFDEINATHVSSLVSLIKDNQNKLQNIHWFIESTSEVFSQIAQTNENIFKFGNFKVRGIFTFCSLIRELKDVITFIPCDERSGPDSPYITAIMSVFGNKLFESVDTQNVDKEINSQLSAPDKNFNIEELRSINFSVSFSIRDYFALIDSNCKKIQDLLTIYKDEKEILPTLEDYYELYMQGISQIKALFKDANKNDDLHNVVINLLKKCTKLKQAQEKLKTIRDILTNPDTLFADLFYFHSLISKKNKHNKKVVIIGDLHRKNLSKMLSTLGFEKIVAESWFGYRKGFEMCSYDVNFKVKMLDTTQYFLNIGFDKSIEHKCNFCTKKSTNQAYKQCSGCKQVHYCSPKCQKYDWEFHKNICACLACKKKLYLVAPIELGENNE
ncbi:MAG: zinc finger MYND domain-containing protein [Candidatus Babeliales bacterium]|nr:zinc finger MYND domain-containing protein [Candidatus Babeliales bacterium]